MKSARNPLMPDIRFLMSRWARELTEIATRKTVLSLMIFLRLFSKRRHLRSPHRSKSPCLASKSTR